MRGGRDTGIGADRIVGIIDAGRKEGDIVAVTQAK